MQMLYIFGLLWSASVLVVAAQKPTTSEPSWSNGYQCYTCQNLTSDSCEGELENCPGNETYCINSTGNIRDGENSTSFVTKGCATQLVLEALLGSENIKPGKTYEFKDVTVEAAPKKPTEPPSGTSPQKPTEKEPTKKPPKATTMVTTTPSSSPRIPRGLFLALWLPLMSSVLWMQLS